MKFIKTRLGAAMIVATMSIMPSLAFADINKPLNVCSGGEGGSYAHLGDEIIKRYKKASSSRYF